MSVGASWSELAIALYPTTSTSCLGKAGSGRLHATDLCEVLANGICVGIDIVREGACTACLTCSLSKELTGNMRCICAGNVLVRYIVLQDGKGRTDFVVCLEDFVVLHRPRTHVFARDYLYDRSS